MKSSTTKRVKLVFDRRSKIEHFRAEFARLGVRVYNDVSYRTFDSLVWDITARDDAALTAAVLRYSASLADS